MHNCRFPFTDCPGCDRCAVPTITIPPETEFLQTRFVMICAIWLVCAVVALAAFAIPGAVERVNDAHQEQING